MTSPAAALGKLSAKKRFKGKSKKQISEAMRRVSHARQSVLDKQAAATSNG